MANKNLFSTRKMLQANTINEAGGKAFAFSARHALAQYAATGCFHSTYYASAEDQLDKARALCVSPEVDSEFIAKTAIYCRQKGAMKDMPAFLCAVLASLEAKVLPSVFFRVIDDAKMLRNFVQFVRSGATGRKSLGTLPRRLVRDWLAKQTDDAIFASSVGQSPSVADVLKMVHPKPANPNREALYRYLLGKQIEHTELLPSTVVSFEAFKANRSAQIPNVPFQMLTSLSLGTAEWTWIACNAPWQTTRMNLNTFLRHGVFNNPNMVKMVADRLRDSAAVRRARCMPYQLLQAFQSTDTDLPAAIRDALQEALEHSLANVPTIDGKVYVFCDVSGSMQSPVTGHRKGSTTSTRCIDVAALISAAILRKNADATVIPFESDVIRSLTLNPRDSVMTNAKALASIGGGGTDCSAPLRYLNRSKKVGDLCIYVSDNESWMRQSGKSTATMTEWESFRSRSPRAKMVCADIQPYGSSQAIEREEILNIGGFSDAVFELLALFTAGKMSPQHWVAEIESISL